MKAKTPETRTLNLSDVVRTDKPHISNSYLSTLKRALIGDSQWFGSEHFLTFGTEHHKRSLQPEEEATVLEKDEELCCSMSSRFRADKRVAAILRGAQTEVECQFIYRGALVLMYLDIRKAFKVWDLKGTSCTSEAEFLKKSREFDYFRQAALYMQVPGVKDFEFIGQAKKVDGHPLFFLPVLDYPELLREGKHELDMLVDIHLVLRKHYERQKQKAIR
jgi:hypothetical protein